MDFRKKIGGQITAPLVPLLSKTGINPNTLTIIGLLIIIAASVLTALNYLIAAGILVLVAGLFDILDGALARYAQKTSKFGAVLDSTFDRLSEGILFFGLVILYARPGEIVLLSLILASLIFSFLISYIRARAEGLGINCEVGFFTRTERVIIMALGLIFNLVFIALVILALFSLVTVIQRLVYVYQQTRTKE